MAKKKTNKRKRSKAARQRQKLIITGSLAVVLVLVIILAIFVFGGCSTYEADKNTVYILNNGKVVSNSIESFDENVYSKKELKSYIKEVIDVYREENGNVVKQKSLKVKRGEATLVMEYASAEEYEKFEGTEIFVGSVSDALEEGYTFEVDFANVTDGKIVPGTLEEFADDPAYQVVIIKANVDVCLKDRQICYVSAANTESVKDGVVVISEGADLLANVSLEDTESTEGTEVGEAVTDEELLLGTDEGMIFDFGEEETVNQYSSVYTYIIYK